MPGQNLKRFESLRVISEDYNVEKRVWKSTLKDLMQDFRTREQTIESKVINNNVKATQRLKHLNDSEFEDDKSNVATEKSRSNKHNIPFVPNFLFRSLDENAKKNIRKWRDLVNSRRTMAPNDVAKEFEVN